MTYSSDLPRRSKISLASQIMALLASAVVRATARNVCRALWYLTGCYPSYHPKGLTPAVLTRSIRALGAKYADVTVASIEWDLMECGGMGTVQRLHVTYTGDTGVDLPKSFVVKVMGDSFKNSMLGMTFNLLPNEVLCLTELRGVLGDLLPLAPYVQSSNLLGMGLIVMEDLGYLRHKKSRDGVTLDEAKRMLAVSATVHKRTWGEAKYARYYMGATYITDYTYLQTLKGLLAGPFGALVNERLPNVKRAAYEVHKIANESRMFARGMPSASDAVTPDDFARNPNTKYLALTHGDMRLDNAFFDDKAK
eukprot:PhM_4_TR13935/c0_g2_i2/m.43659